MEGKANMNNQVNTFVDSQSLSLQFNPTHPLLKNDELLVAGHKRVDCPVEHFVQKLKDLSSLLYPFLQARNSCQPLELSKDSRYVYFRLEAAANGKLTQKRPVPIPNSDITLESELLVKLPLQNQVMNLVSIFEETNGNYHWYLRKRIQERIRQTYSYPTSQAGDRNWFCRLLVVLAIVEAQKPDPESYSAPIEALSGPDLFWQAASLFSISEVPSTDDIETLNLMVIRQVFSFNYK
jgi:hypothetical protein